jgi:hypothetical protein
MGKRNGQFKGSGMKMESLRVGHVKIPMNILKLMHHYLAHMNHSSNENSSSLSSRWTTSDPQRGTTPPFCPSGGQLPVHRVDSPLPARRTTFVPCPPDGQPPDHRVGNPNILSTRWTTPNIYEKKTV